MYLILPGRLQVSLSMDGIHAPSEHRIVTGASSLPPVQNKEILVSDGTHVFTLYVLPKIILNLPYLICSGSLHPLDDTDGYLSIVSSKAE